MSPHERYTTYLATQNKRFTGVRSVIVYVLSTCSDHFDEEQLVDRFARLDDGVRVSRSAIYRVVAELILAGLLRKLDGTSGPKGYARVNWD